MLPYATLDEAAAALGRNLTVAETLWFNYSAKKSDYYLYCHNILFLFLIFSVVPLPVVFISLWRSSGFDKYKIQPKVKLSPSETFKCYKDVMFMFFFVVGPLQLVSYPSVKVRQFFVFVMRVYLWDFVWFWLLKSGFWALFCFLSWEILCIFCYKNLLVWFWFVKLIFDEHSGFVVDSVLWDLLGFGIGCQWKSQILLIYVNFE
jgi:hypothetical protein